MVHSKLGLIPLFGLFSWTFKNSRVVDEDIQLLKLLTKWLGEIFHWVEVPQIQLHEDYVGVLYSSFDSIYRILTSFFISTSKYQSFRIKFGYFHSCRKSNSTIRSCYHHNLPLQIWIPLIHTTLKVRSQEDQGQNQNFYWDVPVRF